LGKTFLDFSCGKVVFFTVDGSNFFRGTTVSVNLKNGCLLRGHRGEVIRGWPGAAVHRRAIGSARNQYLLILARMQQPTLSI
jgi:hypothetical protein